MQNEIHETMQAPPEPSGLISGEFKKLMIPIVLTVLINFGVSYFASQRAQDQVNWKTEQNAKGIEINAAAIKANTDGQTQLATQIALLIQQNQRIAQDLKQLQDDQRQNNFQMNRQK